MGFCPQCGRPLAADLKFCPGCGANRTPTASTPPPPSAHAGVGDAPATGAVGQRQDPGLVLLLILVTFGFYTFFYWWRVTREIDAFTGRPGHAHGASKRGVIVTLVSLLLFTTAIVVSVAALGEAALEPDETRETTPEQRTAAGIVLLLMVVGIIGLVVGIVLLYVGAFRVWKILQEDQRRRGEPNPLSPGLQLFFVLMPYLNLVTMWIAYYRTQKGLNALWDAAQGGATFT